MRLELKYRLDAFAYRGVQAAVRAQMRLDRFSHRVGGRYRVRSLYYDTAECAAYFDKVAGVAVRVKPRLRAYGDALAATPFVSVELKGRISSMIVKQTTHIDAPTYEAFATTGRFDGAADEPVLAEFERMRRRGAMRPTALVAYDREAYEPRGALRGEDGALRVTFDHDVRTAYSRDLFARVRWRTAYPGAVVLEIKTPRTAPAWLERLVRDHGLVSIPNSKYTQAVEQSFPGLAFPGRGATESGATGSGPWETGR